MVRYPQPVKDQQNISKTVSFQQKIDALTPVLIEKLIAESAVDDQDQPQHGHQATVHRVSIDGIPVVIKSVTPQRSTLVWLRRRTLINEHRVYRRLQGLAGTPRCYGLINNQYLILQYIEGQVFGDVAIELDSDIYANLLLLIRGLHERGVAHADLKQGSNLILGKNDEPFLIDFGTAIVEKKGFRPLNKFLFKTARQLDYHGYIKNKYRGRSEPIQEQDMAFYQPMRIERAARWVRRTFRRRLNALREKHAQN